MKFPSMETRRKISLAVCCANPRWRRQASPPGIVFVWKPASAFMGHDIDETTTPVEARLRWTIAKHRRVRGEFPGAHVVVRHIAGGPPRLRVGLRLEGRAPAREHTPITDTGGNRIGEVTSGGYAPSFGGPIAMGYVPTEHSVVDTPVNLIVRDKPRPAKVVRLPFVPHRYHKT